MLRFNTITAGEYYQAARDACARAFVACGGDPKIQWKVKTYEGTAAIHFDPWNRAWVLSLPAMPDGARLTRAEADTLTGYWVHELGHALFTDWNVWQKACAEGLGRLTNALEDVRIERELAARSVDNARHCLETLTRYLTERDAARGFNPADPRSFAFVLAQEGRARMGYDMPAWPGVASLHPKRRALINRIMCKLDPCRSTQDVLDLARWIRDEIAADPSGNADDTNGNPNNGQGEGEGEARQGEGQGEAGQAADDAGEPTDAAQGAQGEGDVDGAHDNANGSTGSQGEGEGEPDDNASDVAGAKQGAEGAGNGRGDPDVTDQGQNPTEPDVSDIGANVCNRNGETPKDVARDNARAAEAYDAVACRIYGHKKITPDDEGAVIRITGLLKSPAKLRRDVTRAVKSPERVGRDRFQSVGRFDRRAYARAEAGHMNVFARRIEEAGRETAVSLLLDISGSMQGEQAYAASCMALHIGDALRAAGVPFEIAGFGNPPRGGNNPQATLYMAKAFGDAWPTARAYVSGLRHHTNHDTHCMPAVLTMAQRLSNRGHVNRRVLLVLTDGMDGYPVESMRAAIRMAERRGVEVVGLGMFYDVSDSFANALMISDLEKVSEAGLGALVKILDGSPLARVA